MGLLFAGIAWLDHPVSWALALGALWEGIQEHLPSPGQPLWQHVWDMAFYALGAGLAWWVLP
jgi:hypothetical protein